jgi:hypothetical protein
LFGTLISWVASAHGGHGYVDTANGDRYFLHRNFIKSGDPRPGASAMFSVLPPANPDAKYPRAMDVVINANTPGARETKLLPKPMSIGEILGGDAKVSLDGVDMSKQ